MGVTAGFAAAAALVGGISGVRAGKADKKKAEQQQAAADAAVAAAPKVADDTAAAETQASIARARTKARGTTVRPTLLTGALGVQSPPTVARKTLLGL